VSATRQLSAAASRNSARIAEAFLVDGSEPRVRAAARPAVRPTGGVAVASGAARASGIAFAVVGPAPIATTVTLYGAISLNAGDAISADEILLTVENNESLRASA
jgi:hypothetical protein